MQQSGKLVQLAFWVFGILSVFCYYQLLYPLPFYSYFSDPELPYFLNSVMLATEGKVQHVDHPGTFLQLVGAGLSQLVGIGRAEVFSDSAIDMFRATWKGLTLVVTVAVPLLLWRRLAADHRGWQFMVLGLLACSDYNAWIYWGTFTPEGAFLVLYVPIILWLLQIALRSGQRSSWRILGLGLLLGLATTIKLTLWPASLFVILVFFSTDSGQLKSSLIRAGILFAATAGAYLFFGSVFAEDPHAQWSWMSELLVNSGRYGQASGDGHAFLGLSELIKLTASGLRIQNFTTLLPMALLCWLAIADLVRRRDQADSLPMARISTGFLVLLCISWLMFLKHPYQVKYLFSQTPLLLGFWYVRMQAQHSPIPGHFKPVAVLLLPLVVLNAAVNNHIVHKVNRLLNETHVPVIDRAIADFEPSHCYFSIDINHPLKAKAFALREAKSFADEFEQQVRTASIFRERRADYTFAAGEAIRVDTIKERSLVVTQQHYADERVQLVYADAATGLFIYYCP